MPSFLIRLRLTLAIGVLALLILAPAVHGAPSTTAVTVTSVRELDHAYAVRLDTGLLLVVTPLTSDTSSPVTGPATLETITWASRFIRHGEFIRYTRTRLIDVAGNVYQTTTRRISR